MKQICIIFALLTAGSMSVAAESASAKGRAIAEEADRRNQGYSDNVASLTMILIDTDGTTHNREMEVKMLEVSGKDNGDQALVTFFQPRDVQGTALLTHSHVTSEDDQWLYLPALKRIKRISASNKTGAFMGSEFSYEDMIPQEVDKYSYNYQREEACGNLKCFVVESYPNYADSGYKRLLVWMDTGEYRTQKIEFYDESNQLLKTLTSQDYHQYLGKYWRPHDLLMVNHRNGKSTRLSFSGYKFKTGLHDQDFAQANLQRGN